MGISDFYIDHGLNPGDDVCEVLHANAEFSDGALPVKSGFSGTEESQAFDHETVGEIHQDALIFCAKEEGYKLLPTKQPGMLSFQQDMTGSILSFWLSTGTVGSYLEHPKQGKTQLFRRKVTFAEAEELFENPRKHTGMGYHEKKELNRKRARDDEPCRFCDACEEDKPLQCFSKNQRRKGNRARC